MHHVYSINTNINIKALNGITVQCLFYTLMLCGLKQLCIAHSDNAQCTDCITVFFVMSTFQTIT